MVNNAHESIQALEKAGYSAVTSHSTKEDGFAEYIVRLHDSKGVRIAEEVAGTVEAALEKLVQDFVLAVEVTASEIRPKKSKKADPVVVPASLDVEYPS